MNEKGFSHFDGNAPDTRPLERRKEIKSEGLKHGAFDESLLRDERGELDPELLAVESYTLSGFLIEKMWEEFKKIEGVSSNEGTERIPLDQDFWKNFYLRYANLEESVKDNVLEKARAASLKSEDTWGEEEKMLTRWFYIQKLKEERLGRPSFRDFFAVYTRLARVAEEAHEEQIGHDLGRKEYEHLLEHPSFKNMMLQMMMNNRESLMTVMAWLENMRPDFSLDDPEHKWSRECFVITMTPTGPILEPNEEALGVFRAAIQNVMEKFKAAGRKNPQVLRCPVLYTGLFNEMNDWMRGEFSHHYLDQKY